MAINFPTSLDSFSNKTDNVSDVMAVDINDVQDAVEALEAKVGITSSAVDTSLDYKVNNFFVENTRKILLYENTAPTGWVIENTLDDKVVMVTKGSVAGGETGGGVHSTGTWTQPDHTLIEAEMPAHTHSSIALGNLTLAGGSSWQLADGAGTTGSKGGGGAHNHGTAWRPAAYNCIIAKYTGA